MKKPFIGVYNLANCVTMLGIAAAWQRATDWHLRHPNGL